jgi:4-hydroxybenzoate polyprenyltransferase
VSTPANFLKFIRFSHTIFAMPFALGAMLVAARGWPGWRLCALIVLCMVFARSAAMCFNRVADWEIDKRNPRTAGRHRLLSRPLAIAATVASSLLFMGTTYFINPLCLALSPVALGIIFFYSLTKRFTWAAQFFLGLALSVAPMGAWLAVKGQFDLAPMALCLGVLLWVAGFDTIYATQDYEVDRQEGLKSLVTRLGIPRALVAAQVLHALMYLCLIAFGALAGLGLWYWIGIALIAPVLWYEHHVAAGGDLRQIDKAFFTANAVVGAIFVSCLLLGLVVWPALGL